MLQSVVRDTREVILLRRVFCALLALSQVYRYPIFAERLERGLFSVPAALAGWYHNLAPFLGLILIGFLVLAALDLYPRLSLIAASLSYFLYQAPLQTVSQGHIQNLPFLVLLSLCFCPVRVDPNAPRVKGWLFEATRVYLALMFFFAGVCKLWDGGWAWLDGRTLQFWCVRYHYWYESWAGLWLAQRLELCEIGSWLVVLFELSFVSLFFFRRLIRFYGPAILIFVVVMKVFLGIEFFDPFVLVLLVFLPWRRCFAEPVEAEESESSTWGPRFAVMLVTAQVLALVLRVNAWPISDYSIYSQRRSLTERPSFLRLAKVNPDRSHSIVREPNLQSHNLLLSNPSRSAVLREQIEELGLQDREVLLLKTTVVRFEPRLRMSDEVLLRLEPKQGDVQISDS